MLLRGGAGLVTSGLTDPPTDYSRLDLALYSPVCLTLGALAAVVAWSASTPASAEVGS